MISEGLYDQVLIQPANTGGSFLRVVSGYASPKLLWQHVAGFRKSSVLSLDSAVKLELGIGMVPAYALTEKDHLAWVNLARTHDNVVVRYNLGDNACHSKVYSWCDHDGPLWAWAGSANYSWSGFFGGNDECLVPCDAEIALQYCADKLSQWPSCLDVEVQDLPLSAVAAWNEVSPERMRLDAIERIQLESVYIPLTVRDEGAVVPKRSGVNWGNRPEYNRNPNQAYLPLSVDLQRSGFFPDTGVPFLLGTEDNEVFIAARRQQNGKGIQTVEGNDLLGLWIRRQLGVPPGTVVSIEHLKRHGVLGVTIFKYDDTVFKMTF